MSKRKEFGDFQTPSELAEKIIELLSCTYGQPGTVIEPTAGLGNFIAAAQEKWGDAVNYYGYEVNLDYCRIAKDKFLKHKTVAIKQQNFFFADWCSILCKKKSRYVLVLGNPPWVTNAVLGVLDSSNLPKKMNFQGLRGFDAKTGKANFDIAEWIIIKLVDALPEHGLLAMLCKTATARKVLAYFWKRGKRVSNIQLRMIDAKETFDVAVNACLLILQHENTSEESADVFDSLDSKQASFRFGMHNGEMIANLYDYRKYRGFDGGSNYKWRSGIKHDAAKVMELTRSGNVYSNGLGESIELETEYLFPLLKSSDIGNCRVSPRKYVIVTQRNVGDNTRNIQKVAPKTWAYLCSHADILEKRKSSIYRNRSEFSIFGIGEYSFSLWKVAISGLYKTLKFVAIPPVNNKPVMLDDTCYFIPCRTEKETKFWVNLLNSEECINFLHSLVFFDAKRPVNIGILKRIDFGQLARYHNMFPQAETYLRCADFKIDSQQTMFVFEEKEKYLTKI